MLYFGPGRGCSLFHCFVLVGCVAAILSSRGSALPHKHRKKNNLGHKSFGPTVCGHTAIAR